MMRLKHFCFLFFALVGLNSFSQGELEERYAQFRSDIQTEFMVEGLGRGETLPATYLKPETRFAKWAEGTIHLGWYIGTVALEYAYVKKEGEVSWLPSLDSLKTDLYYSLKAAQRLDFNAETYFPGCNGNSTPVTNGFFIRDDVRLSFAAKMPGIDTLASDYTSAKATDKEMSQDQAYHLLMGLDLARYSLDGSEMVQGESLRNLAKTLELLTMKWIAKDNWVITNPVCLDENNNRRPVARGAEAQFFGFPISKLAFAVSGGSDDYFSTVSGFNQLAWEFMADASTPAFFNEDVRHMAMCVAALSEGWFEATKEALLDHSAYENWWVYPLVYGYLYGERILEAEEEVKQQLEVAPYPIVAPFPDTLESGWASSHKYISEIERQEAGDVNAAGRKYSGVDYMMALMLVKHSEKLTGVGTERKLPELTVYPNPTEGELVVGGNIRPEEIQVVDALGRPVEIQVVPHGAGLKIAFNAKSGVYWLSNTTTGQRVAVVVSDF